MKDKISILLSSLAILLSMFSIYFQFFYVNDALRVAKIDFKLQNNKQVISLAIVNTGKTQALITYFNIQIAGSNFEFHNNEKMPFILNPNEIKLMNITSRITKVPLFPFSNKTVQEHNVQLDLKIITGKGIVKLEHIRIGTILEQNNNIIGNELLLTPIQL